MLRLIDSGRTNKKKLYNWLIRHGVIIYKNKNNRKNYVFVMGTSPVNLDQKEIVDTPKFFYFYFG